MALLSEQLGPDLWDVVFRASTRPHRDNMLSRTAITAILVCLGIGPRFAAASARAAGGLAVASPRHAPTASTADVVVEIRGLRDKAMRRRRVEAVQFRKQMSYRCGYRPGSIAQVRAGASADPGGAVAGNYPAVVTVKTGGTVSLMLKYSVKAEDGVGAPKGDGDIKPVVGAASEPAPAVPSVVSRGPKMLSSHAFAPVGSAAASLVASATLIHAGFLKIAVSVLVLCAFPSLWVWRRRTASAEQPIHASETRQSVGKSVGQFARQCAASQPTTRSAAPLKQTVCIFGFSSPSHLTTTDGARLTVPGLRLMSEMRAFQRVMNGNGRGRCNVIMLPALTWEDFCQHMETSAPRLVHLSGHCHDGHWVFESPDRSARPVPAAELGRVLGRSPGLRCVVLSGCHSVAVGRVVQEAVNSSRRGSSVTRVRVLCATTKLDNRFATAFTARFYRALMGGRAPETAFALAKADSSLQARDSPASVLRFGDPAPHLHDIGKGGRPILNCDHKGLPHPTDAQGKPVFSPACRRCAPLYGGEFALL